MPRLLRAFLPSGEIDSDAINEAAKLLRAGRLVAIPTETVYGLAANALEAEAVRRIFAAKGRPSFNPLIVHVASLDAARQLTATWPDAADDLARAFWPGPLSIIVPKTPAIPSEVTAGLDSVALRMPAHPVARALLERASIPLAAPSANRSNGVSPTTAQHVLASLGDRVDAVLDGGPSSVGIESTVIDLTGSVPVIARPGGVSTTEIERIIGPVRFATHESGSAARTSPGQLSRHYAPDAETMLFASPDLPAILASLPASARIGGVVRTLTMPNDSRVIAWEALGNDPAPFARDLYATLHRLDSMRVTHILLERLPETPEWIAVSDRVNRASTR